MQMQELDDIALLQEYVNHASEEAFAALVTRHVNKVYSVALRHTRNPSQAEEITQAVFVILAKKSRQMKKGVVVSGWLYETARLTTVTYIRSEIRRTRREQEAHMQSELDRTESDAWTEIAPVLDAAMAGLNEADRHAVVLRFFDGKSMREVGTALGANEDAAKKRVGRALEKMRLFFAKRGVVVPAAVLETVISAHSVEAAPVGLAKSTAALALSKGAVTSISTLTTIKGALKVMAWTKAKTAIIVGVATLLIAGTVTVTIEKIEKPSLKDRLEQLSKKPGYKLTSEAARFVVNLKHNGRLPGFSTNKSEPMAVMIAALAEETNGEWQITTNVSDGFPASRTVWASKHKYQGFVYFYTVTKMSETDNWQLRKAWRNDSSGKVVEEFPVP
jgi:RNA polymerase sigma factor (sigma-70 family)